ncbi:MAG: PASTA domain-containing protein [Sedimentisphaerales bacterium]|nr:PASTA domain-containing protein [Sedimentisphaerales bacterium]
MKRTFLLFSLAVISLICFTSNAFAVDGWASENGGVTGGEGGTVVTVDNVTDFNTYITATGPYIVQVSGTINLSSIGYKVYITSDKTIKGVNADSTIIGNLAFQQYASNVIIRDLNITNPTSGEDNSDGISVKENVSNVWITKCTFYDCGDGSVDVTEESDFVTVSWCKFYYVNQTSHRYVNLIGHSDTNYDDRGHLRVTMHHNWYSTNCTERMPRVRFGQVHFYNNYIYAPGNNYCVRPAVEAQVLVENNYFQQADEPIEDYDASALVEAHNNIYDNCTNIQNPGTDTVFDPPYSYSLDSASSIPSIVTAGAGNVGPFDTTPPDAPTGLTATGGSLTVSLDWNDNSEGDLAGYNVYRSTTSGSGYTQINSSLVTTSDYSDNSVTGGITYYYVVTALDTASNESGNSNEDSATPTTPDVTVPDVVGMSQSAASTAITSAGLVVGTVTTQCSDTVPAGEVISQSPTGGSVVPAGSAVDLVVSSGQPSVPDVTGMTEAVAIAAINAVDDISYGSSTTEYSDTVPAGDVISQSSVGTVPCGTVVNLVVSLGPCTAVVPDVTGMDEASAIAAINAVANISYGTSTYENSATVPEGDVISQSATGTVACGTVVDLVVSSGQCVVTAPDVIGMDEASAIAAINAVTDLSYGTSTYECSDTVPAGDVISQSAVGSVPCGTVVDLVVSTGQPTVPNVVGMTEAAAIAAINAVDDISYGISYYECSDTVPAGDVISQTATGTVPCSTVIDLVVSTGQPSVPDLTLPGITQANAIAILDGIDDISYGSSTLQCSETVPAGEIIAQSAIGTVPCGTVVDLVVSSGSCYPAAPTGLTAVGSVGIVELDWDENSEPDLAGYNVYRSEVSGSGYVQINSSLVTSPLYDDIDVVGGTTYYYVVTAVNTGDYESDNSNEASATPQIYGDFTENGSIDFADLDYLGQLWLIEDCNATADADLNDDCVLNFYEFAAFANNWRELIDTTPPEAPTGLSATGGDATVSVNWDDNSEADLAGYNIYRSTMSGSGYVQQNVTLLTTSDYTDNSVVNGTTYYYVVTAVDLLNNESGYSAEASAAPQAPQSSLTLQENEAGYCGVDGPIEDEWSGYTGDGYSNTDNAVGNGVDYSVEILTAGQYSFVWRFAHDGGSDRLGDLIINSTTEASGISFPDTGGWSSWEITTTTVNVTLTAGVKSIRLEATTSGGLANIDYMEITGPNLTTAACQ